MIKTVNKTNTSAPDSDYPYGNVKDNTGTNNGTPVNKNLIGDYVQFFEKLFADSGLVANNLPDNAYSGFQIFEAFKIALTKYPYKSYTAAISQTGTSAPTVNVMPYNGIGNIVWTRIGAGIYTGTLVGAFAGNCWVNISGTTLGIAKIVKGSDDAIFIFTNVDPSTGADDSLLSNTAIEIRIYQ